MMTVTIVKNKDPEMYSLYVDDKFVGYFQSAADAATYFDENLPFDVEGGES